MRLATHGNGNGFDDLYILPENELERKQILKFLKTRCTMSYQWSISDVKGQEWFGKKFIEVPFGASLAKELTHQLDQEGPCQIN